jgi:hypothetical protein
MPAVKLGGVAPGPRLLMQIAISSSTAEPIRTEPFYCILIGRVTQFFVLPTVAVQDKFTLGTLDMHCRIDVWSNIGIQCMLHESIHKIMVLGSRV